MVDAGARSLRQLRQVDDVRRAGRRVDDRAEVDERVVPGGVLVADLRLLGRRPGCRAAGAGTACPCPPCSPSSSARAAVELAGEGRHRGRVDAALARRPGPARPCRPATKSAVDLAVALRLRVRAPGRRSARRSWAASCAPCRSTGRAARPCARSVCGEVRRRGGRAPGLVVALVLEVDHEDVRAPAAGSADGRATAAGAVATAPAHGAPATTTAAATARARSPPRRHQAGSIRRRERLLLQRSPLLRRLGAAAAWHGGPAATGGTVYVRAPSEAGCAKSRTSARLRACGVARGQRRQAPPPLDRLAAPRCGRRRRARPRRGGPAARSPAPAPGSRAAPCAGSASGAVPGGDVVEEAAPLVVVDHQQRPRPGRARASRRCRPASRNSSPARMSACGWSSPDVPDASSSNRGSTKETVGQRARLPQSARNCANGCGDRQVLRAPERE